MAQTARDLAAQLSQNAEAVCRRYLPNGHREGRYWLVGDIHDTPGRSLFVRLRGPRHGPGAAGKWTDAATGEHGDLLDLIAMREGAQSFRAVADLARGFLGGPAHDSGPPDLRRDISEAARRLYRASRSIRGTLAETYLRARGIDVRTAGATLRFHPRCFYRPDRRDAPGIATAWPALIGAVTDDCGAIVGVHRTWLDPGGAGKAPLAHPRRAMGQLVGGAIRFGPTCEVLAAGEGIETVLSVRTVLRAMSMVAAGSAVHLGRLQLPPGLRRLYVLEDDDVAGRMACDRLIGRARVEGVEAVRLCPSRSDFNDDLVRHGRDALREALLSQLAGADVERFSAQRQRRV